MSYFLGLKAHREAGGLHLCQSKDATNLLIKTNMFNANASATSMAVGLKLSCEDGELFEDLI